MAPVSIHYKEYGQGDNNLIVIHGFLGSLDNWHTLSTKWAESGLHVFALDMRNHGKSPHTAEHNQQLMVEDVLLFLKEHDITHTSIIGHSMGGKVAMRLALQHPDKISKLIVADIAPRKYRSGAHDDVFKAIFNIDLKNIQSRKDAEDAMKSYLGDFGTRQFILKSLERVNNSFAWKFNIKTLYESYEEVISGVELNLFNGCPTLIIRGGLSLYINERDVQDILRLFPNAQFQTIEQAGHWLHADQPEIFLKSVLDFVN